MLNDAVAKVDHKILTINSCNTYEHFTPAGSLSIKGKKSFLLELDDLLQRFDLDKIKLLPNPKNPPRNRDTWHDDRSRSHHPTQFGFEQNHHSSIHHQSSYDQDRHTGQGRTISQPFGDANRSRSRRHLPTPPPDRRF